LTRFDHAAYPTHLAAEVPARPAAEATLAERFGVAAALEALEHAGLPADLSGRDAGVFFGSSTGGMLESEECYVELVRHGGWRRSSRRPFGSQQVNAPGDAVARRLRVAGPVENVSSACSSATLAIGLGLAAIRDGEVDLAVVGGADSLCRTTFGGFNALGAVDARPCTPFRAGRAGLSLGEGAAALVLEPLEAAAARGARPLGELAGAGASCDAHHMTAPDPAGDGAALALRRALEDAGLPPAAVDTINTHGTGTPLNDAAEYRALVTVFGERARSIPLTATKGSVGHLLGSAGAIEAVTTVLALERQRVPPTPGDGTIDPELPVRLVRGQPLEARLEVAVSLSLAFGGCNGALVLCRWNPP
jgi:3-oxoacyl-[acyl-carrier-protein] synthase II